MPSFVETEPELVGWTLAYFGEQEESQRPNSSCPVEHSARTRITQKMQD